ncbi:hypothetical protein C8F04DRAFT_1253380 [Mycena alexandri]|uniref:Uncharacterized protein n=1 Tax=Mycena alexandri TaxID=1745969 RepID=A0AAD6XA08_9AGAR|nr:hypothetical protein C8F04DRAFT_1270786 [Mycena alexandri]KAJ7040880.1 hypothetical protein C8F04DRAFT_1253380 [Mycena alexandri]
MSLSASTGSSSAESVLKSGGWAATSAPSTSPSTSTTMFSAPLSTNGEPNRSASASILPPLAPTSSPSATSSSTQASSTSFPSSSAVSSYLPAMSSSTVLLLSITISTIPTETSSAAVFPPQVNSSNPNSNRSTIIAGATVSVVAFLGLVIVRVMLYCRPSKDEPRGKHTRRAFMIHPRAEDEDDWKQATLSPSTSPTTDTPVYSPISKAPHYIVHSRTSLDQPRSVFSQAVLWAATHLEQPLPLSRATSPPSTCGKYTDAAPPVSPPHNLDGVSPSAPSSSVPLLWIKSPTSSEEEPIVGLRNRDVRILGRLP